MTARRFLRLTHGWLGVILAIWIVVVAGTGASLAFMSEMFLAQYGDVLRAEAPANAPRVGIDQMFESAKALRGGAFEPVGVLMPHTRVPGASAAMVFGMEKGGDPVYPMMVGVDPFTGEAKGAFSLGDAFGHDMLDFHYELVFGQIGATVSSVLGILLVLFAATGLWLWWPKRGYVWRKARAPHLKGRISSKLFHLHGWLGVWTALLVVLFSLTGTAVARPGWFGPMLADAHEREPTGGAWARQCAGTVTPGEAATAALQRFPGKEVTTIYLEAGGPTHVYLRGRRDLNKIEGDSIAWVHPTCPGVIETIDAGALAASERAGGMMHSLHGGYTLGPVLGPILVVLTGLSLVFFSISGAIVFFTRTWRPRIRRVRRELTEMAPAE
jgi:uncharacterized iron-regulated membrane protein